VFSGLVSKDCCVVVHVSRQRQITRIEQTTFDWLVLDFEEAGILGDGRSVTVEEQVLIVLYITCHNNSMRQTAVKFQCGLYISQYVILLYPFHDFYLMLD
jgi:hypothetical protein